MNIDFLSDVKSAVAGAAGNGGLWLASAGDANMATVDTIGFGSVGFLVGMQGGASGTANLFLEESDDGTNWAAVPIDQIRGRSSVAASTAGLVGTLTAISGKLVQVGVLTKSRYYRMRQGNSSTPNGLGVLIALLGDARQQPVTLTSW